jgi:hypothetical protein
LANSDFSGISRNVSLVVYSLNQKVKLNPGVMKKYLYLIVSVLAIAACSSPKYTYNFDYYDYNSGKKNAPASEKAIVAQHTESVFKVDETTLVASTSEKEVYVAKPTPSVAKAAATLKAMSREEKKELKKELKKYVKESKKSDSPIANSTQALSGDLKLAAILGAIGIVLLIIGGDALSIIGAIALLAGLFFLIRYLINQ